MKCSSDTATSTSAATILRSSRKRVFATDVAERMYEIYKTNAAAKVPKIQDQQQTATDAAGGTSPTSAETNEPSTIAAIATNSAASESAAKNLQSDEMLANKLAASFHPRIKYTNNNNANKLSLNETNKEECNTPLLTAIPTSVVVPTTSSAAKFASEPLDIKPIVNPVTGLVVTPSTSVIKPVPVPVSVSVPMPVPNATANPQAAAIAAALIRDGYHSFQQQIRAQELMKFHTSTTNKNLKVEENATTKFLETFLRQQRNTECDNETASDNNDGDEDDDNRYNSFDDIHLMEGSRPQISAHLLQNSGTTSSPGEFLSDESQKYLSLAAQAQAQALRNFEFSFGDLSNTSGNVNDNSNMGPTSIGPDGEPVYECRHCGKKYRWKSTLRRHENVECGGKEPSHQCPYCPYKSKQRGNLGVHVRKHHSNLPQLASKRRSKYSVKYESNPSSANVSDDSNSKLIVDCSK